jgi:hypothetical protein
MPASSGRQENIILDKIESMEEELGRDSKLRLYTYDNKYLPGETGIECTHPHRLWLHEKCPEILKRLLKRKYGEGLCVAWFDFTGGLLDERYTDMQSVIEKMFGHGSLFFVTLAIKAVRGLDSSNRAHRVYNAYKIKPEDLTDLMLTQMVEQTGKYLKPCMQPYVYKRRATTYGVFGYIVGKH